MGGRGALSMRAPCWGRVDAACTGCAPVFGRFKLVRICFVGLPALYILAEGCISFQYCLVLEIRICFRMLHSCPPELVFASHFLHCC